MQDEEVLNALAKAEVDNVEVVSEGAVGAIVRSETDAQLSAAHKFPRSVQTFLREAMSLATITQDVAASCIYSLPRDGKMIVGPSVRLAEIVASSYGNLHVGSRVVGEEGNCVVAQGVAWDLQKNLRVTVESRRRITKSNGRRFSDDMVITTENAACSIALRNAIFRVVPRSYVDVVFTRARNVAVGDSRTLCARRNEMMERLGKLGLTEDRILTRLDVKGVDDIGLEQLETLIGLGTAIKEGTISIDKAFPAVEPSTKAPATPDQDGKRMQLGNGKRGRGKRNEPEPPTNADGEVVAGEPVERTREPGED